MIFPFPYTNLYNLNLDWMIKTMKEMQEIVEPLSRVVNSVNGMTGDVQITKQFLLQILESMVSKFNGRAGDVTLTAADVNSTMIDITWTSDPGDVIEDIAQNVRDQLYAIGKRVLIFVNNQGVPDQIYFLTLVGDVVTPQIYSPTAALAGVASFNGQTGAVTATGSDLDTANDDDTPISESIGDLQSAVNDQSQQIDELADTDTALESGIAIIVDGDTATQAVPAGGYAYIKNNTHGLSEGLYKNISGSAFPNTGGTADNTIFASVTSGGLNDIHAYTTITSIVNEEVAVSGSSGWQTFNFYFSVSDYKAFYIECGVKGATYNSIIITREQLALFTSISANINTVWTATNLISLSITNGRVYGSAKTDTLAATINVYGLK